MAIAANPSPLRLLALTSLIPTPQRPDFGIFNARQFGLLAHLGVDVRIVVPRLWLPGPLRQLARFPALADPHLLLPEGVRARLAWYLHPPAPHLAQFEWRSKSFSVSHVAKQWHAREPVDVVLGIDMTADAPVAVHVAKQLALPVATLAIGSDVMVRPLRQQGLRRLLSHTLARSDQALGVSQAICRVLASSGPCRREPEAVYLGRYHPAVERSRKEQRRALGIRDDDCVAVFVGNLSDAKGMPELLSAASSLLASRPSLRLLLVGAGPYEATWRTFSRQLPDPHRIMLTGRIAPEQVGAYLAAADFMVFPSRSEGLPGAVLEAMDCGLPVVATRVGGLPEAVIDRTNGLLVPPCDPKALAIAMALMIDDRRFRLHCAAASRERALTMFDSIGNARRMINILRSIIPSIH